MKDYLLKDAAKCLNINYSTAKTILRIFRIEKRIEKKNTDEERELKDLLCKFKKDKAADVKEENEENTHSLREDSFKSQKDTKESQTNTSLRTGADLDSNKGITAELALRIDFFSKKIKDFHNTLNDCYKEIKNNQVLINTFLAFAGNFNSRNSLLFNRGVHVKYTPNN